jgi:prepilin-type N-terminal cleavage/methylation domain-containing protein
VLIFRRQASRGFTLIELLVSLLVASIFLLATAMIVIETMRLDREETGRTQVQAELTQAMQYIQQDLAEALYIYNDAEQPNGDRTPDLIQRLYTPGWIRRPDGAIPVVAFWKLSPIPQRCYAGSPTPQDIRRGQATLKERPRDISVADWDNIRSRRNIYTLVVYYLQRNYDDAGNPDGNTPWEGNARIARFELQPFDDECTQRSSFFREDPDPFQAGFLAWPRNPNGQTPIANSSAGPRLVTLVSNIFSSREGSPQVAPACPQGYAFGGAIPTASPSQGWEITKTTWASMSACGKAPALTGRRM